MQASAILHIVWMMAVFWYNVVSSGWSSYFAVAFGICDSGDTKAFVVSFSENENNSIIHMVDLLIFFTYRINNVKLGTVAVTIA